jgi:hypothetical protein
MPYPRKEVMTDLCSDLMPARDDELRNLLEQLDWVLDFILDEAHRTYRGEFHHAVYVVKDVINLLQDLRLRSHVRERV